ncbi:MAG: DUF2788 domain-containing protein [bacterium]
MNEAQFSDLSLSIGLSGIILYMIFIMYRLAKDSKAGNFGTFIIFAVLGLGIFGFVGKEVIKIILSTQT